jgi:hypothetical protein
MMFDNGNFAEALGALCPGPASWFPKIRAHELLNRIHVRHISAVSWSNVAENLKMFSPIPGLRRERINLTETVATTPAGSG